MARYHLDTSFLIDWQRGDQRVMRLKDQILAGRHKVSFDPIVETEFFAAERITRKAELLFWSIEVLGERISLSQAVCRRAAEWLSPMDDDMRKAHFADALIAAAATVHDAVLVAGDTRIRRVFRVKVRAY